MHCWVFFLIWPIANACKIKKNTTKKWGQCGTRAAHYSGFVLFFMNTTKSKMAVGSGAASAPRKICVLGAGVVGLTTAWRVRQCFPNASITLYADKFTEETTSHVAAGMFCPIARHVKTDRMDEIMAHSFNFFNQIVQSDESLEAGISVVDGYQLYTTDIPPEEESFRNHVYHFSQVAPSSLTMIPDHSRIKRAYHYTTLMIECRKFLPYAMKKLKQMNVSMERRKIDNLQQLEQENFDVIFNCCGLGSQQLFDDGELKPMKGQLLRVVAPWIKRFIMVDDTTYIFPGQQLVVLGGVRQLDCGSLQVSEQDSEQIMKRCTALVPSLVHATVDHVACGIRPSRSKLRLERDYFQFNNGTKTLLVHNYG